MIFWTNNQCYLNKHTHAIFKLCQNNRSSTEILAQIKKKLFRTPQWVHESIIDEAFLYEVDNDNVVDHMMKPNVGHSCVGT